MVMGKKLQAVEAPYKRPQESNVNIQKVSNGFVVSGYKGDWSNKKTMIAKTQKEAKSIASKLL